MADLRHYSLICLEKLRLAIQILTRTLTIKTVFCLFRKSSVIIIPEFTSLIVIVISTHSGGQSLYSFTVTLRWLLWCTWMKEDIPKVFTWALEAVRERRSLYQTATMWRHEVWRTPAPVGCYDISWELNVWPASVTQRLWLAGWCGPTRWIAEPAGYTDNASYVFKKKLRAGWTPEGVSATFRSRIFCLFGFLSKDSFIYSVVCLTTGPKPLPERALHIVRSRASSFKWEYPLLSLGSSSSFLRLRPRLPVTSIPPFIFPSITLCRRQFLRKMWPIQLAFLLLISCSIFLRSLTLSNTSALSKTIKIIIYWTVIMPVVVLGHETACHIGLGAGVN